MRLERIERPEAPALDVYRDLREPELRTRQGLFVAEGRECVRGLLRSHLLRAHSVLLAPAALEALRPDLESAAHDLPVYVAEMPLLREISGLRFHQGCLALGVRPSLGTEPLPWEQPGASLLVGLEGVANPDNVGGIFRNARAFGADAVLLGPRCGDPLYRKAVRTSMGAVLSVPFRPIPDWPAGLRALGEAGFLRLSLTPAAGAIELGALGALPSRLVLLAGSEWQGLGSTTLALADLRVRIRMQSGVDSLNVATACAIALHHVARYLRSNESAAPEV